MNAILRLKNVEVSFDGIPIISDINFDLKAGEFMSIIGPSGCGKTTLVKTINGLIFSANNSSIIFKNKKKSIFLFLYYQKNFVQLKYN